MISIGICIPTYQRGEITKESIIKIYNNNKRGFDENRFRFFISDDCSKDGTFELLKELSEEIKCITIKQNKTNIGFEGNNGECIKMCDKDYAWMLGDDDTINVKIEMIIDRIDDTLPDFIIIGKNQNVEEKVCADKEEGIKQLLYESTWMSGLIYKKTIIEKLSFERYAEGEFPQSGAIFEYYGTNNSSIQYIYGKEYASILRKGVVSYSDRILEIYAKGWTNLVMGLPLSYDYKLKLELLESRMKHGGMFSNMILLSLRSQNQLNYTRLNEYYPYLRLYSKTPYIIMLIISILPKKPLIFLRKWYAKVKKINLMQQG